MLTIDLAAVAKDERDHAADALVVDVGIGRIVDAVAGLLDGGQRGLGAVHVFGVGHYNFAMLNRLQILVSARRRAARMVCLAALARRVAGCGQKGALLLPTAPEAEGRATLPQTRSPRARQRRRPSPRTGRLGSGPMTAARRHCPAIRTLRAATARCTSKAWRSATLAREHGTPLFVYSKQCDARLRSAAYQRGFAGRKAQICYAMKANSSLGVLQVFAQAGCGFDIVSGGELERVLAAGAASPRTSSSRASARRAPRCAGRWTSASAASTSRARPNSRC